MKVRILGCASDGGSEYQFAPSYLINDSIAIDAGSIGFMSSIAAQRRISHVFLSHTHLDHVASLPIFLDNVYQHGPQCATLLMSQVTQECLIKDFFNDRVWPDLFRLSQEESPFFRCEFLRDREPITIGDVEVTPISLDHVTPTFGFLIREGGSAIAIVSDTSPVNGVWDDVNRAPELKAVFLECAFPDRLDWLAEKAKHLTPTLMSAEIEKVAPPAEVFAVHIKPAYYDEVVHELIQLENPRLRIGETNRDYVF